MVMNAVLCVLHVSLLKVGLSNVLDPNTEMNRKSRPEGWVVVEGGKAGPWSLADLAGGSPGAHPP